MEWSNVLPKGTFPDGVKCDPMDPDVSADQMPVASLTPESGGVRVSVKVPANQPKGHYHSNARMPDNSVVGEITLTIA